MSSHLRSVSMPQPSVSPRGSTSGAVRFPFDSLYFSSVMHREYHLFDRLPTANLTSQKEAISPRPASGSVRACRLFSVIVCVIPDGLAVMPLQNLQVPSSAAGRGPSSSGVPASTSSESTVVSVSVPPSASAKSEEVSSRSLARALSLFLSALTAFSMRISSSLSPH